MIIKDMPVGQRIKEIRKQKGLTQKQLADKLDFSYTVISQYERGVRNPKVSTIERIAGALDVDPSVLLFGETNSLAYRILNADDEIVNAITDGLPNGNQMSQEIIDAAKKNIEQLRTDTINKYDKLNVAGQEKANGFITALTETQEYTTPDKALQESGDHNE